MERIERFLDGLHSRVVSFTVLKFFTAFVRVLLAFAFVPPSIPKILHRPFTMLSENNPVGDYFAALYRTGFYYDFIGWSQLFAAVLLLIPRTSHLGALLFFPIIINITVLTNSVGFKGTWLVTILMTLACTYLVCWDYPKWKSVLFYREQNDQYVSGKISLIAFIVVALPPVALLSGLTFVHSQSIYLLLGLIFLCIVFGAIVTFHFRYLMSINAEAD